MKDALYRNAHYYYYYLHDDLNVLNTTLMGRPLVEVPEGPGVPLIQKTQSLMDILFKYVLGKFYFITFQRGTAIKVYLLAKGGPKKESEMSSESNGIGGFASLAAEVASQQLNAFHAMIKTNCC